MDITSITDVQRKFDGTAATSGHGTKGTSRIVTSFNGSKCSNETYYYVLSSMVLCPLTGSVAAGSGIK